MFFLLDGDPGRPKIVHSRTNPLKWPAAPSPPREPRGLIFRLDIGPGLADSFHSVSVSGPRRLSDPVAGPSYFKYPRAGQTAVNVYATLSRQTAPASSWWSSRPASSQGARTPASSWWSSRPASSQGPVTAIMGRFGRNVEKEHRGGPNKALKKRGPRKSIGPNQGFAMTGKPAKPPLTHTLLYRGRHGRLAFTPFLEKNGVPRCLIVNLVGICGGNPGFPQYRDRPGQQV